MFPSRKWFYPGMHVKRWIALLIIGFMALSLACAMALAWVYRNVDFVQPFSEPVQAATLQFIPHPYREILVGSVGLFLTILAIWKLSASLMEVVVTPSQGERLVDRVYARRILNTGPKIVTIGGGTGQAVLLRGLKEYTNNLTAIVTVVDDGGSSGRLRREFGALPPGDVRQCIGALAVAEPLMTRMLNYRFDKGEGLEGHRLGNLM
ncbi:MAG: YvcK family protein, partial [Chloroflexi bacterium]|nr:YvcK family protein [Chloroflexota bacterium]